MASPLVRAVAALAASTWLLTGCATKPAPTASETPTGLVISPVASTAGTPTASVSLSPAAALPTGYRWVTSAGHGVKFAVPSSWTMFNLTTFNDPAVRQALTPIAARLGKSVDTYIDDLTKMNDLIVAGPDKGGYAPTISVRKEEAQAVGEPPSKAKAQGDVDPLKGTITAVTPVVTALGAGYAITYTRPGDAGATLYCASLGLPSSKNTAYLLTLESDTLAERDALVASVVSTLQGA